MQAGPSQQGFSPAEATALNTQAMEGVGQGYAGLQQSLAQQQAARGGGNDFLPSGAQTQLQAELGTSAANQLAAEQRSNLLANYAQGRANFTQAANALGGVSSQMNPLGYAQTSTGSGEAAAAQANTVAAANNAWMSALGGALGGIVTGPLFKTMGAGTGTGAPSYSAPADFSGFSQDLSGGGADFSQFAQDLAPLAIGG